MQGFCISYACMLLFVAPLLFLTSLQALSMPITVKVDGKTVKFPHEKPHWENGRTLVPMRGVFEAIGAYVDWDPQQRLVTCRKNNEEVALRIGSKMAHKNGAEIMIDVAPKIMRGTTMVPLRFIAESLGAKVTFDGGNNIVEIDTGA
jgi:hypothetical protein